MNRARLGLVVVLVVAIGLGVFLTTRVPASVAFDVDSSSPDGWKAIRLLLEDRGVRVDQVSAEVLRSGGLELGDGDAVVMAAPSVATTQQIEYVEGLADGGGTVLFGEAPLGADDAMFSAVIEAQFLQGRTLVDEPPLPVGSGVCEIEALVGLGPIDAAFSFPIETAGFERGCYTEDGGAYFVERDQGAGRVVALASPLLWVNARLQPNKEEGGEPLANGATAVRLLGDASRVTFVDPVPTGGTVLGGSQDPLTLLPLPVKLALAQLVGAFVLYLWWRSRRLGPPIPERLPVEIAGSELVVAVGDLLRRRGNPQRAAATVRDDTRRVLSERLGLGPHAAPSALVQLVAARTGREPAEVGAALYDDPAQPVASAESLVTLVRTLDTIRQEVLHVDVHAADPTR